MTWVDIAIVILPFSTIIIFGYFLFRSKALQGFKKNMDSLDASEMSLGSFVKANVLFLKPFFDAYLDFLIGISVRTAIYFMLFNLINHFSGGEINSGFLMIFSIIGARITIGQNKKSKTKYIVLSPEEAERLRKENK